MADPITAMVVVAGAAELGSAYMETQAANSKTSALKLQQKQNEYKYQRKMLSNLDMTEKVLASQTAEASVRGIGFNSPSFNAIQRDTLETATKQGKDIQIESSAAEENIKKEKENVRNSLYASLFGHATNFALGSASVYNKMPRKA